MCPKIQINYIYLHANLVIGIAFKFCCFGVVVSVYNIFIYIYGID